MQWVTADPAPPPPRTRRHSPAAQRAALAPRGHFAALGTSPCISPQVTHRSPLHLPCLDSFLGYLRGATRGATRAGRHRRGDTARTPISAGLHAAIFSCPRVTFPSGDFFICWRRAEKLTRDIFSLFSRRKKNSSEKKAKKYVPSEFFGSPPTNKKSFGGERHPREGARSAGHDAAGRHAPGQTWTPLRRSQQVPFCPQQCYGGAADTWGAFPRVWAPD